VTGLRFQDPWWLVLLVPLALAAFWALRRRRRAAIVYSDVMLLAGLPRTWAMRVKQALPWVQMLGLALVVVALARPQRGREEFRVPAEGIAIEMCIDRSDSMRAMDFQWEGQRVNRLGAVKQVFRDFVAGRGPLPGRPDDLIGLIAFGGYAEAKCPLTLDHGALLEILDTVQIPEVVYDNQGRPLNMELVREDRMTAIGDTLAVAVERLKRVKAKSRVIILLSDGEQTAGVLPPDEAAKIAKTFGIKIYAIGVGTTGEAPFPVIDQFGRTELRAVEVRLDEATLRGLAETTGGRYFNAQDTETLQQVYAAIDRLEKSGSVARRYTEYRELYQYLMFPGLALVLLQVVLASTRYRSLP
jgi:Ca-activated chloride channel family protein